jgi:predicted nucleic acid-binding Zn ribbon protein
MANGDERDPESQQLSRKRRARLAALLIILLIAGWLWLLWMIR